ncbi:MAG: hypothetical protein JWM53_2678 [bacterium]|nr:hypothetical protein [bacterium]
MQGNRWSATRSLAARVALQRAPMDPEQLGGEREVLIGGVEHAGDVLVGDPPQANVVDVDRPQVGERQIPTLS